MKILTYSYTSKNEMKKHFYNIHFKQTINKCQWPIWQVLIVPLPLSQVGSEVLSQVQAHRQHYFSRIEPLLGSTIMLIHDGRYSQVDVI